MTKCLGFCLQCNQVLEFKQVSSYHKHLQQRFHGSKPKKEFIECNTCKKTFPKPKRLAKHFCTVMENEARQCPNVTQMEMLDPDSMLGQVIMDLDPVTQWNVCVEQKYVLPTVFPPLQSDLKWKKNHHSRYKRFGNTHGLDMVKQVLKQKAIEGKPNQVILPKCIRVTNAKMDPVITLPPSMLRLKSKALIVEEDEYNLIFSLKNPPPPESITQKEQPLDQRDDLIQYQKYKKHGRKYPFSPHR